MIPRHLAAAAAIARNMSAERAPPADVAREDIGFAGDAGLTDEVGFDEEELLVVAIWYVKQIGSDACEFAEDVGIVWDALRSHMSGELDAS